MSFYMTYHDPHGPLALRTLADLPASPLDAPWFPASWMDRISVQDSPAMYRDCGQCWLWHGANNGKGHGRVYFSKPKRGVYLHRYSFEKFHDITLQAGMSLDHLCRHRNCFNPLHLESVTPLENYMRGNGPAFQFKKPSEYGAHISQEDVEGFFL